MSVVIRPETGQDRAAIWSVNQAAFEGDAEANLVDALRDGGFAEVSLVAEVDEEIVGHILFSRVAFGLGLVQQGLDPYELRTFGVTVLFQPVSVNQSQLVVVRILSDRLNEVLFFRHTAIRPLPYLVHAEAIVEWNWFDKTLIISSQWPVFILPERCELEFNGIHRQRSPRSENPRRCRVEKLPVLRSFTASGGYGDRNDLFCLRDRFDCPVPFACIQTRPVQFAIGFQRHRMVNTTFMRK